VHGVCSCTWTSECWTGICYGHRLHAIWSPSIYDRFRRRRDHLSGILSEGDKRDSKHGSGKPLLCSEASISDSAEENPWCCMLRRPCNAQIGTQLSAVGWDGHVFPVDSQISPKPTLLEKDAHDEPQPAVPCRFVCVLDDMTMEGYRCYSMKSNFRPGACHSTNPCGQTGFEVQGSHIGNADAPVKKEFERQVAGGTCS
jgi:hypothetical protein